MSRRSRELYDFSSDVKKEVLLRCNHHCEQCGRYSQKIECHHKLGVGFAKRIYPNIPPELIASPTNCVALCPDCHYEADKEMSIRHAEFALPLLNLLASGAYTNAHVRE